MVANVNDIHRIPNIQFENFEFQIPDVFTAMEYSGYVTIGGQPLRAVVDSNGQLRVSRVEVFGLLGKSNSGRVKFQDAICENVGRPDSSKRVKTVLIAYEEAKKYVEDRRDKIVPIGVINKAISRGNNPNCNIQNNIHLPRLDVVEPVPREYDSEEESTDEEGSDHEIDGIRITTRHTSPNQKRKHESATVDVQPVDAQPNKKPRKIHVRCEGKADAEYDGDYKGIDIRYVMYDGQIYLRVGDFHRRLKRKNIKFLTVKHLGVSGGKQRHAYITKDEFKGLEVDPGFILPGSERLDLALD